MYICVLQQLETEGSLSAEELSGLAKVSITLATERYVHDVSLTTSIDTSHSFFSNTPLINFE